MKIVRWIKISFLIIALSPNLMLGQKNETPIRKNKCFANQIEKSSDLEILQSQPNFVQTIIENCQEFSTEDSLETGAFFRFIAF